MILYPYDIIRLKNSLGLDSEEFLRRYTILERGDNIYFPTVKLRLNDDAVKACPFLADTGCSVYIDRPTACRTYPLERAVGRSRQKGAPEEHFFMTDHAYCLGHKEKKTFDVKNWIRNQRLFEHNMMNDLWTEIDTIFAGNPWKGEGMAGEKQQLAFLICYNIDGFRRFIDKQKLLDQFRLDKEIRRRITSDDGELLKFGFEWLKLFLSHSSSLLKK
jgi:Fe-S-cluster containining protein